LVPGVRNTPYSPGAQCWPSQAMPGESLRAHSQAGLIPWWMHPADIGPQGVWAEAVLSWTRDMDVTVPGTSHGPRFGSCCQSQAEEQSHVLGTSLLLPRGSGGRLPDEPRVTQPCWHGEGKAAGEAVPCWR